MCILLARLESALRDLQSSVLHPPESSTLTQYEDLVKPSLAGPLGQPISQAQAKVEQIARDFVLPSTRASVRRAHLAAFQLLNVDLYGTLPSSGLRGYGEVAPATARYLEAEIPKLETLLNEIIRLLERGK